MIDKGEGDRVQKQQQRDNLREVLQYCENKVDCRRQLVLQYFGERFDKSQCNRTCDNCERAMKVTIVDRTDYAVKALKLSEALPERHTLNQLVDMFKGSTAKRYASLQDIPFYGAAADLSKTEAERILQSMLTNQVFATQCKSNAHGFVTSYLRIGPKAKDLQGGRLRITLTVCDDEAEPRDNFHNTSKRSPKSTNKRVKITAPPSDTDEEENYGDDYYLEDSFINDNSTFEDEVDLSREEEEDNVYASSEHELPERVPSPASKIVKRLPTQYRQILDRGVGMVILDDDDEDDDEDGQPIKPIISTKLDNDDIEVVGFERKSQEQMGITSEVVSSVSLLDTSVPPSLPSSSANSSFTMTHSGSSNCYEALLGWRDSLAMSRKVNAAFILSNSVIGCIARNLPCTTGELAEIPGMTPERCEKYSKDILQITSRYK